MILVAIISLIIAGIVIAAVVVSQNAAANNSNGGGDDPNHREASDDFKAFIAMLGSEPDWSKYNERDSIKDDYKSTYCLGG